MTPERQKTADRFGKPEVVIPGDAIREKEKKWSYGLYSVLMFNFPDDIRIERVDGPGGYLRAKVIGESTLVVIDGVPVINYNYSLIPNIPPSEVKSVEVIRFADNFSRLYRDVYPQANPMNIPITGHVIAIYTHGKQGLFGAQKAKGILQTAIKSYAPQKEFYAPKYESVADKNTERPDLRSLIHWEPQLQAKAGESLNISYYNPDKAEEVLVIVEAIAPDGQVGYQEFTYKVEPKTD